MYSIINSNTTQIFPIQPSDAEWSGDRIVHKYMSSNSSKVYDQLRAAACISPNDVNDNTLRDALDLAMMEFGRGVIRTVGEEIDRLEIELRSICPGLDYVDLETDRGRMESSAVNAALCYIDGIEEGEGDDATMQSGVTGGGGVSSSPNETLK